MLLKQGIPNKEYENVYFEDLFFFEMKLKNIYIGKGLKGKKGSYDAYLIPEGIEDYSYTKDGKEIKGSQYKFKLELKKK